MRLIRVTAVMLLLAVAAPMVPADPPTSTKADPPQPAKEGTPQKPVYPTEVGGKSLADWIKLTTDRDPAVRDAAIKAICCFDPAVATEQAGPALINLFSDKDS